MDLALSVATELATICVNLDEQIDRHEPLICCRGGYATVSQGTLHVDGIKVAIKTERSPGDGSAIKREARVWSKLHHENIVSLLGFTTILDASVSLVSPWQEKGNAHDYVQDRGVDPRPLLLGVARGLDHIHSLPMVHSDLKGKNVLIAGDGRPLITDFGFSFLAEPPVSITRSGGTLKWMAPEILDDGVASVQSDMWAFGMTALELFTAQEPFHNFATMAVIARIVIGPPGRPAAELTCDRLTDAWWSICTACWKQDPALRPSASDVLADIERAISTNQLSSSGCFPGFPTADLVDDAQQVTSSNRLIGSQGVNFERPMNQHLHYTSLSSRTTDDWEVVSTLPSLESHVKPDWRPPFDIEASKSHSTQFEPANSIQLVPVTQPFLEWYFAIGLIAFIAVITIHSLD